jgi:streptomycin 6-kinase
MVEVPAVVQNKAGAAGAEDWLERLPALVSSLEADWSIAVGRPYEGGTEAFVADAIRADGVSAVLKVLVPGNDPPTRRPSSALSAETDARCSTGTTPTGAPCSWSSWPAHVELGLPLARRLEILCATAARTWRPAPDCGLPTGANKARWLADFIVTS